MANTKDGAKSSPARQVTAKARPATKGKAATKAKPPTAKSTPAAKPERKQATSSPAPNPAAARPASHADISPEQRRNYIEVAAFYIAERRGFASGNPLQDWMEAEAEIERLLAEGLLGS